MSQNSKILTYPGEYDSSLPDITLGEYMLAEIDKFGDNVACIDSETKITLTFRQVIDLTRALAAGLQNKYKLKATEAVGIALPSCLEYPVAVLGVNLCGAVSVLINPSQTTSELKHSIQLSKPRLWIATEEFSGKFQELYPSASNRPPLIIYGKDGKEPVAKSKASATTWLDVIKAGKGKQVSIPAINAKEDIALILFSSGTTGVPKGVTLTHLNYTTARRQNYELTKNIPANPDDLNVVMLPLYHTFGISSMFDNMVRGLRYVLIRRFSFKHMLEAIQEFRITIMSIVPAIAAQLVKLPVEKHYDLSSVQYLFSGAAALSKDIQAGLVEKFSCLVIQGYGMTESTLRTHSNFLGFMKEGSIGVVMPFCESKVIDITTGEALGPNQEGEICVRGPLIMKGYIGNDEATKATVDADGWLHSGDIGFYDDEGFFFITDRLKELIKYKGLQVSPTELEQILLNHPEVMDAAVIAVPDEDAGELPRGYVVVKPGSKVTEDELAKFVEDQVSPHKRLRGGVIFVDNIPKTATGKIMRRELKNIKSKL